MTVGPAGGPRDLLWTRFAGVLGLDADADWAQSETTNASLGGAEVTVLRRLNAALAERGMPRKAYVAWVREGIVKEVLAGRRDSPRASVPPRARPWVEEVSAGWIDRIRSLGVDVVGDLDELRPAWPDDVGGWPDPDKADPDLVADLAIESLAHVLDRVGPDRSSPVGSRRGAVARLARRLRR